MSVDAASQPLNGQTHPGSPTQHDSEASNKRARYDSTQGAEAGPSTLTSNGASSPPISSAVRIDSTDGSKPTRTDSHRNMPTAAEPPLPNEGRLKKQLPPECVSDYDPANFPAELPKSTSVVNYRQGLFLAPMVRIGSLPTRLLSLEYGADLVWGPEIVDRAIMGAKREVDEVTGAIHFVKDGKSVFTTHPVERPYVIYQLGCATPAWAYESVKLVTEHDDVAGVDLNCGCPKNFSTTGGMGAGLLPRPDLLCDILRAMRRAAPPHVAVTCKLRLLPTEEATKALVRQICQTGAVDAITIHCRTKEMRPREAALLDRIREVVDTVAEETGGRVPVCHNGDSWDYHDAQVIMKNGKVTSSMLARGPEKNPSCFSSEPQQSVPDVIWPKWMKYAIAFQNQLGNTKYCMGTLDWTSSHKGKKRSEILKIKESVQRSSDYEIMCNTEYYKDKVDHDSCRDPSTWEEYVLGDLKKVLKERQEKKDSRIDADGAVPGQGEKIERTT
ncbi:unnamed protein product [Sympodiomycopsis kandeliae]